MLPRATPGQLTYKVKRDGQLFTAMPCITLCGDTLPPLLVTKHLTLDADVLATGLRQNEDVIIVHGPKGYVNTPIVIAWAQDVVVPYVDSLRPMKLGEQEEAILLLDNLPAHKNEGFLQILNHARIRPVFIPPHSSHALQAEDLLTFALLKQELKKSNNLNDMKTQAQRISNLVAAIEAATTQSRNRSAFRRAGIASKVANCRLEATIDEVQWNLRICELFPGDAVQN
ncbi:MAG: hypothetical protein EZS28_016351 [Streblomastix strix]|uniref:DDE-1 domain-containing protein n=1 Tax=Streblomastix strix TaxID=222440 RepID=A0A5J4VZX1_9EUKA|nr:MAG: hypothetical protein EZS28_016351 [Streblomastix strix]